MILKLKRGDETLRVRLQAVETEEGAYKLGIWVKDDVQGIGTLTYATRQGAFGALGHGITDTDTRKRRLWRWHLSRRCGPAGQCSEVLFPEN